ncbi:hypothetical protein SAMN05216390_1344 [Lachnospiraceae bacterium KH1T2]|nr:hypothetical protein SAMN05216390_1344 [Lachnospiraceae bacterium KH1T2]
MLKIEKEFSLKQLIEDEDFIIVLDTNVLLNVYRYSPDFSDFAMNCLDIVKDNIVLPSIVRMEYGKRCRAEYAKMNNRVSIAKTNIQKQIDVSKKTVLSSLNDLKRFKYPDVDVLRTDLENKMNELISIKEAFFDDRSVIDYIAHSWDSDWLMSLVEYIENKGNVLPELTVNEIYEWDEEGEHRYKKNIPPGYMDAKNKKGVRQYSDFFIWKEVLRYADANKKDVIFVTDDTKEDWWRSDNDNIVFCSELLMEFEKTGCRILPLTSDMFYKEISDAYNINRVDTVDIALNMTDSEYGEMVAERVFDNACYELYYNAIDYIDEETAHIGTEGIDEFEIVNHEFIDAKRLTRDGTAFTYSFEFNVVLEGTSYDYWGKDDETKEIITSLGCNHVFEGTIYIQVEREADIFIDLEECSFESATIVKGELKETSYEELYEDYDEDDQ